MPLHAQTRTTARHRTSIRSSIAMPGVAQHHTGIASRTRPSAPVTRARAHVSARGVGLPRGCGHNVGTQVASASKANDGTLASAGATRVPASAIAAYAPLRPVHSSQVRPRVASVK
jgi:hypothetical protein